LPGFVVIGDTAPWGSLLARWQDARPAFVVLKLGLAVSCSGDPEQQQKAFRAALEETSEVRLLFGEDMRFELTPPPITNGNDSYPSGWELPTNLDAFLRYEEEQRKRSDEFFRNCWFGFGPC
jgi:hypothetical protein